MKKIFIIGPTASGKTELAKFIFDNFKTEIISVDSAQIYQDMNIGSAKPSSSELNSYPHHLINLIKPTENYSVSQFKKDESIVSSEIFKNKNIPLLVGGTMLYFNALEYPIDNMPASSEAVRKKVSEELEKSGLNHLYEKLLKIDPECTKIIKPNDKQRVMRALEVYYLSGKPISSFQTRNKTPQSKFNFLKIGLMPHDRRRLHEKIEIRAKEMIDKGFWDEVMGLIEKYPDLNAEHNSMRCVGYRQVFNAIGKKVDKRELMELIIIATRQLAKRQLTWMRRMDGLKIFDPFDLNKEDVIKEHLKQAGASDDLFTIIHCEEVIEMGEHPTKAISQKTNSSIAVGFGLLKAGKVDAFCSAGNTGAMLVGSMFKIHTIPGVIRPCITSTLPAVDGSKSIFCTKTNDHPHFFWEDTATLSDAPAEQLQISQLPNAPDGAEIVSVDVVIRLRKKTILKP